MAMFNSYVRLPEGIYIYVCVCVCRMGNAGSTNGNGDFRQQKLGRQNEVV